MAARTLPRMLQAQPDPPVDGIGGTEAAEILGIQELHLSRHGYLDAKARPRELGRHLSDHPRVRHQ